MDRKQKERLRFFLKARKRADKVLAARREAEQKKLDHDKHMKANQELMKQYTGELHALAEESGVLVLAEQAASRRGGSLVQEVCYYIDYGMNSSSLQHAMGIADQGKLKASHLALRVQWEEGGTVKVVEVRVHKNGQITFQSSLLPLFPFLWHRSPGLLRKMLDRALEHPALAAPPVKQHG